MVLQDENFVSKEEFQALEKELVVSNGLCRLLIFPRVPGSLWLSRVTECPPLRASGPSNEDRTFLCPGFCVALE